MSGIVLVWALAVGCRYQRPEGFQTANTVAVVIDSIQSVKDKIVIEVFQEIYPQSLILEQELY